MMSGKIIIFVSLLSFLSITVRAQMRTSEKMKPQWLHKLPKPTNSSFMYEIHSAMAASLDAAREKCTAELISKSGMKNGIVVFSQYNSKERLSQKWNNGKLQEKIEHDAETVTSSKSNEVKLYVEQIAEYWEQDLSGNYYLTKLYAKSELAQPPLFDNVELTTSYGIHGLWRSLIIPGWGQFHKKANLKGGLFLGGCAALAVGAVFMENQRTDYVGKIFKTHDANLKRSYATKRDHFATGRNICIGACAALYIYNLIDAIAAPGARRVVVKQRGNAGRSYAVAPTVLNGGTPGLAASWTF